VVWLKIRKDDIGSNRKTNINRVVVWLKIRKDDINFLHRTNI